MKIALLGCKGTTLDLLHNIVSQAIFDIDLVVTLPEEVARKNRVAFYRANEIIDYCRRRAISFHIVRSYNLKNEADFKFFEGAAIDLLLVIGWERLVPAEVLNVLGKFACGMHGSPYGLPKGRGRSPLNWALLTAQNKFLTYLFKYDPHVDAGHIIGFRAFDINDFDTIAALHMKNRIAMGQLLATYIPLIEKDGVTFVPQPPEIPTYYPKREPDDSGIDWQRTTLQIYNLIRAVAPPYPPAYAFHQGKKVFITEAYPFTTGLFHDQSQPGTIVDISVSLHQFVVKTKDGTLVVKKFDGVSIHEITAGDVLQGVDHEVIMQRIVQRYGKDISQAQREI